MSMTSISRRWVANVACAASFVAIAGCGTTVQGDVGTIARDGTTLNSSGEPNASTAARDPEITGVLPTGSSATVGGSGRLSGLRQGGSSDATGSSTGGTGGGPARGTAGPSGVSNAPGVTATEIKLGITYLKNGDQAAKAAGYNLSRGDEEKNWQAVTAEVNARGGMAGRKLVPVYYAIDAQSTQTYAAQEQAACTHFTQDSRVFAVVTNGTPDFTACLNKAGVLHATTGSYLGRERDFYQRFPTYFGQRPSQDRMHADLVSALVRQSYFSGWDTASGGPGAGKAKVGIVVIDMPMFLRPLEQVLLPALRKAGHPVDPNVVYRVPETNSAQEAGPGAAATKSAVLRFQQEGVTHVIVLDANGSTTLLFAQNSSSQVYFPRLGVTSASGIQQLYDLKALDDRQVSGATGLGWTPSLDLPAGQGDKYLSKAAPECLEIIKRRTGQTFSSTTAAGVALFTCDAIFPLAAALQHNTGPLNVTGAVRAIESVGGSLPAAVVPRLFFSRTRHDGLETAFDMAWDASCPCVRYRDAGHRMP